MVIIAKAGDEYSTVAPPEFRLLGRAKTCKVVTEENESKVQAICAAILRMGNSVPCAAIAEAIQYEQPGTEKNFDEWSNTAIVEVPTMLKDYSNLREVREAGRINAIISRVRAIKWQLQIDAA